MDLEFYNKLKFWELSEKMADYLENLNIMIVAAILVSAQNGENITSKSKNMPWDTSPTLMKSLEYLRAENNPAKGIAAY